MVPAEHEHAAVRSRAPAVARHDNPVRMALVIGSPLTADFFVGELAFFKKAGFDVTVIGPSGEQLDRVTQRENAGKIPIPITREIHLIADLQSLWFLWRALRRLSPTLLDYTDPKAAFLGGIAGYLARVPFRIYTMRGLRLETATGLKRQVLVWAERVACALADRVVCNSHSLRQKAIDLKLLRAEKAYVLGNGSRGIDQARFAPTPERVLQGATLRATWRIPLSAAVIGFAGRLARDKGVLELVAAYQQLKVGIPDLHLLLLGELEAGIPYQNQRAGSSQRILIFFAPGTFAILLTTTKSWMCWHCPRIARATPLSYWRRNPPQNQSSLRSQLVPSIPWSTASLVCWYPPATYLPSRRPLTVFSEIEHSRHA